MTGRHRVQLVALTALLVVLAAEIVLVRPYLDRVARSLRHPDLRWLLVALICELASMAAFAYLQHQMLVAGGTRVPMRRMLALTYAANAVSATLPAGSALSSGYTFRRMRGWGASVPLASFTLIASGALSTFSFGLLGLFGAALAGSEHSSRALLVVGVLVGLVVVPLVRWLGHRPNLLVAAGEAGLRTVNRALRRGPDAGRGKVVQFVSELTQIRPRNRDWFAGLAYAAANWLADLLCLIASCRAVGARGATIALAIVAYLAGMSVSSLSLLPGGLGIVDGAMIIALTHGGISPVSATAAVLLYRLISLVFVTLGWGCWAATWRIERHRSAMQRPATAFAVNPARQVGHAQPRQTVLGGRVRGRQVHAHPAGSASGREGE